MHTSSWPRCVQNTRGATDSPKINLTQNASCFMGLIVDSESPPLPPNVSLIATEAPWFINTAPQKMKWLGEVVTDVRIGGPLLQRTQPLLSTAGPLLCPISSPFLAPPVAALWALENVPCHFTAICWKKSAMLAMTDLNGTVRFSALSRLHPIARELWALPREVTERNFNERPCFEERKEKNHLRITFRLKTEWSFCKLIISSPRRLRSATVKTKAWILFWHGVWDGPQSY